MIIRTLASFGSLMTGTRDNTRGIAKEAQTLAPLVNKTTNVPQSSAQRILCILQVQLAAEF